MLLASERASGKLVDFLDARSGMHYHVGWVYYQLLLRFFDMKTDFDCRTLVLEQSFQI